MNKETTPLEAFERLTKIHNHDEFTECYNIIETALKEHELMKNAKIIVPNKKISEDDFEKLRNQRMFVSSLEQCEIKPLFDETTTKKLKALDIIKENEVNVQNFKACLSAHWEYELFEEYCQDNSPYEEHPAYVHPMTREQFEIVKEVLKND